MPSSDAVERGVGVVVARRCSDTADRGLSPCRVWALGVTQVPAGGVFGEGHAGLLLSAGELPVLPDTKRVTVEELPLAPCGLILPAVMTPALGNRSNSG